MNRIRNSCFVAFVAIIAATPIHAETTTEKAPDPRIRIVNIAKVLRNFHKANQAGQEITALRASYVTRMDTHRAQLKDLEGKMRTATDAEKKELATKAQEISFIINGTDKEAQEKLSKVSNDIILRTYQEIKAVIADLAKANNLALVLCGPGPITADDDNSPNVAQLMLQTPALQPFYSSGIDMTDTVIELLNKRYPPKTKE